MCSSPSRAGVARNSVKSRKPTNSRSAAPKDGSRAMCPKMAFAMIGDSAAVGSSRHTSRGLDISARAKASC